MALVVSIHTPDNPWYAMVSHAPGVNQLIPELAGNVGRLAAVGDIANDQSVYEALQ